MIFARRTKLTNISILILALLLMPFQEAHAANRQLVIFQVQTGAAASASQEYISIYNNSAEAADISNWCVVYASASDATQTQLICLTPPNSGTKLVLPGHTYLVLASSDFLNAHPGYTVDFIFSPGISGASGHVKLLDSNKSSIDKVGWGAAANPEGRSVVAHPTGKILQRLVDSGNFLKDTDNNFDDFQAADLGLMQPGNLYEENVPPEPLGPAPALTELLPDAEGADAGKEFIEFYNPHAAPINLAGYNLQLGPAYSKSYPLPGIAIEPGAYVSLSDQQTGITLPNTSASIRLLAPNGEIVSNTEAYDQTAEGASWAFFNNAWQLTYAPTPGVENQLLESKPCPAGQERNAQTGSCKNISPDDPKITFCKAEQELNPATNRCRKISALNSVLLQCKAGQVRNLGTGRCRSIISSLAGSQPCKPGQTRNPETKSCRNAVSVASKKPCPAGQERNAQTGRCRKSAASAGKMNSVKDVQTGLVTNNVKWWAAGAAAIGSAGYAVYEWRREAWLIVEAVKDRIIPG